MSVQIHPTASVADGAELGVDVEIGPFTMVGPRVKIGDRTKVGPQVVIDGVTRLGADNVVVGQANLGSPPQDLSYAGEPTQLEIGDGNTIREFVTINRGTVKGGGVTRVGSQCLLMACCHVAHDCQLEDRVIMANGVLLAGHVLVGRGANISGAAAAHHFVSIGEFSYVGGMTRMNHDVPPYMVYEGHQARVRNVNVVGLERAGFAKNEVEALRTAFRQIYRSGEPRRVVLDAIRVQFADVQPVMHLIETLERTELGLKGRFRESLRTEFLQAGRELILGEVSGG